MREDGFDEDDMKEWRAVHCGVSEGEKWCEGGSGALLEKSGAALQKVDQMPPPLPCTTILQRLDQMPSYHV